MGVHGSLVGIALHEDVGLRSLRVVDRIEHATRLVGVDLGHQLLGHRLELLLHSRLDLDGGDDADHARVSSWRAARTSSRVLW